MNGYLLIDQDTGALVEACHSHSYDAEKRAREMVEAGNAEAICIAVIHSVVTKEVKVTISTDRYPVPQELGFFVNLLPIQDDIEPAAIPEAPPIPVDFPAARHESPAATADDEIPI